MQQHSRDYQKAQSAIYTVIQNLIDSQEALVEIGEKLADSTLKRFFLAESLKRAEYRGELEAILNMEGVSDLRETGTTAGAVHHAWAGFKFRFTGGDRSLLATADQGENELEESYEVALETHLALPIRQVLTVQALHVHVAHEHIKSTLGRIREDAA